MKPPCRKRGKPHWITYALFRYVCNTCLLFIYLLIYYFFLFTIFIFENFIHENSTFFLPYLSFSPHPMSPIYPHPHLKFMSSSFINIIIYIKSTESSYCSPYVLRADHVSTDNLTGTLTMKTDLASFSSLHTMAIKIIVAPISRK